MVSKVVRDVSCSVLLVPRAAEFWSHGIVAAIGDTEAAQKIAGIAGTIAGICGLPLTVLSVAELLAQAIVRINNNESVTSLFKVKGF
jgi:nucleotide-binding universal stress UspA family protein